MNGPEHYLAAEELLKASVKLPPPVAAHDFAGIVQTAQVHATLALAAAVALASNDNAVLRFWRGVAS